MVRLAISDAGSESGALLREYLQARGIYDDNAARVVSYGLPIAADTPQALNRNAGKGKLRAMRKMRDALVRTVPLYFADELQTMSEVSRRLLHYPLFARKNHGMGGKDIQLVLQAEEIPWRIAAGYEWFSTFIPTLEELRVWVFQGEHLGTYAKVMRRPYDYTAIGRNFKQGFEFEPREEVSSATRQAADAVKAVGLDFAAVDVLMSYGGLPYVLEANTAPGVIRSGCQATLVALADRIVEWDAACA